MTQSEMPAPKKRGCGYFFARLLAQLVVAVVVLYLGNVAFGADRIARPAPSSICCTTPADRGLDYSPITFTSRDGVTLAGWAIRSKNRAAVILLHGYNANRLDMLNHAEMLAQHGYGVLMYDLRGHGESGGDVRAFGWPDVNDVSAALDFLAGQDDVDPNRIGILGFSVGGQIALRAAAQTDKIKAVVADAPSDASSLDFPPPRSLPEWISDQSDKLAYQVLAWRTGIPAPPGIVPVIGNIAPRPILLISADLADWEQRSVRWYYENAREPKALWEIPIARHGGGILAQPEEYTHKVTTFFDQALLKDNSP